MRSVLICLQKKEAELDSVKLQISDLEKGFKKEKTQFDRYTQYIHKRQTFERAWDRSYIQVHLDERGEIYLSSNYYGEHWLNHVALRVYDQGDDAKTDYHSTGRCKQSPQRFYGVKVGKSFVP